MTMASHQGISVKNVTVKYKNGHRALWDVNFEIPDKTITGLVGINGAGKSTLFKAMMGFLQLAQGTISIHGYAVSTALKNNLVSYVPQAEEVDWTFPILVKDVVMMGRYGHMGFFRQATKDDFSAVEKALARVGMTDYKDRQIGELSGGQKKRVFLARSIAQNGQIILLDEPFAGIDVQTEDQIISLLSELRSEGRVMLVSTHNLGSVAEFCDRTILIKGTVLNFGLTEEVFTRENLEKAFGGVLRHFSLGGTDLHEDGDSREVSILSDDERPFVQYGNIPLKVDKKI
tara:strand:+ start:76 stop:939 length:864 start_codon:yes stop_codon:yes gene_type:complete